MSKRLLRLPVASLRLAALAAVSAAGIHCGSGPSESSQSTQTASSGTFTGPIHPQASSSLCLDVVGQGTANGTAVQVWSCSGNANQQWTYDGTNLRVYGTKCLDVTGGNTTNGTRLQIWDCSTNDKNQMWTQSGSTLQWTGEGKCMDLTGGVVANGTPIQQWACASGNTNQEWSFAASTTPTPTPTPSPGIAYDYAPYFPTWVWGGSGYAFTGLADLQKKSGLNEVTIAFVLSNGGCNTTQDIEGNLADMKAFEAAGGHVKASFGGADGDYVESKCSSASALATALEGFVDATGITDLDFDIEQDPMETDAVNAMRGQALQIVQASRGIKVAFTLPANPSPGGGLTGEGESVVSHAISAGVTVSHVNFMTMDYGDSYGGSPLAPVVIGSLQDGHTQLMSLVPGITSAAAWAMVGVIPMIGKNDDSEVFSLADATTLAKFVVANGVGLTSFWSIDRDQPGSDYNYSSTVETTDYAFNAIFEAAFKAAAGSGSGSGTGADAGTGTSTGGGASCAPSWTTTPTCGGTTSAPGAAPDLGPNVLVFDPTMSMSSIQSQLDSVYSKMDADQFDNTGYAYLFKPGNYALDVQVGFYTHVIGLGMSPDDVTITGAVRAKADWLGSNNATCNFWRTAENLAVVPTAAIDNGTDVWATSQGTSLRRIHMKGSMILEDSGGWASGGFIGDSKIDTEINSGSQQQYLTRNVDLTNWQGSNWNMVFVGDGQAPSGTWPHPPYTVVPQTPVVREKPFLYIDAAGNYDVMVPALKTNSTGSSWGSGSVTSPTPPGSPLSIDLFYVAKPGVDTAETINAALAQGKHLLLTPGDYKLDVPIQVTNANTVVLGIGLPVLTPTNGNAVLTVADVDGVSVAGILIEAAAKSSPTLLQLGPSGSSANHAANPTALFDVNCRIGGDIVGTAEVCFTINSNDAILENSWLWRADHGAGADWNTNKSNSGIVVNGNDVTAYGLFSEHHQQYQTLWNGNGGAVYFYQSEMPYDPPSQSAWMSSSSENGYPSYKVASSVTTHTGEGIGIYSFFDNAVYAANAIETPSGSGIVMHHMMTFGSGTGGIDDIINGTGGSSTAYSTY